MKNHGPCKWVETTRDTSTEIVGFGGTHLVCGSDVSAYETAWSQAELQRPVGTIGYASPEMLKGSGAEFF